MIIETKLNVPKVMVEEDINWNWMNLDHTLSMKRTPGSSNAANTVNKSISEGLVNIEDSGHKPVPHYRISEEGYRLVKNTDADNNEP